MQENEFERKVQQVMDTFQVHPSDGIWEALEKGLKEKKRRRILFFLLFSALLLSGGGAAYYILNANRTHDAPTVHAQSSSPVMSATEGNTAATKSADEKQTVRNDDEILVRNSASVPTPEKIINRNTNTEEGNIQSNTITLAKENGAGRVLNKMANKGRQKEKPSVPAKNAAKKIALQPSTEERETWIADNKTNGITKEQVQQTERTVNDKINTADTIEEKEIFNATDSMTNDSLLLSDTALIVHVETIKTNNNPSKIRWAIDISGGINSSHGHAFSFHPQNAASAFRDQQANYAGLPQRRLPSDVNAGVSFSIGFTGEISLSHRSSVTISPLYKYASERIRIGNTFGGVLGTTTAVTNSNSRDGRVYESGGNNAYSNQYHSMGVALHYQRQLNKNSRTAIIWNAGIAPLFLVATNALVYDTVANGIYYRDKSAFRKLNMNVSTGIFFKFGNEKAMQWAIGPQFSFQTLSVMKKDVAEARRFQLFSGVGLRMYLPKKK